MILSFSIRFLKGDFFLGELGHRHMSSYAALAFDGRMGDLCHPASWLDCQMVHRMFG